MTDAYKPWSTNIEIRLTWYNILLNFSEHITIHYLIHDLQYESNIFTPYGYHTTMQLICLFATCILFPQLHYVTNIGIISTQLSGELRIS